MISSTFIRVYFQEAIRFLSAKNSSHRPQRTVQFSYFWFISPIFSSSFSSTFNFVHSFFHSFVPLSLNLSVASKTFSHLASLHIVVVAFYGFRLVLPTFFCAVVAMPLFFLVQFMSSSFCSLLCISINWI